MTTAILTLRGIAWAVFIAGAVMYAFNKLSDRQLKAIGITAISLVLIAVILSWVT